jgi:hypothetical protein
MKWHTIRSGSIDDMKSRQRINQERVGDVKGRSVAKAASRGSGHDLMTQQWSRIVRIVKTTRNMMGHWQRWMMNGGKGEGVRYVAVPKAGMWIRETKSSKYPRWNAATRIRCKGL